jgi:hypothetical protein
VEIVFLHKDGIEIANVSIDGHEIIRQIMAIQIYCLLAFFLTKLAVSSASTSRRREEKENASR